jgi:hypothetical protein
MAAGLNPIFVTTPRHPMVRSSTADAGSRDGTAAGIATLFTASANGAFFKGYRYQAEATTTLGMVRIYIQKGGAGNKELIKEIPVNAVTVGASTPADSGEWYPQGGIQLSPSDVVFVSQEKAEAISHWLEGGGDY